MNIFSPHIPFPELTDIADNQSVISAAAREHLATCSHCSKQLENLRQTIGLMRADTTEDAPAELLQYARNIFRSRAMREGRSLLTTIIASLVFDSLTSAPAFGLRSQATAGRQLIYSAEAADIDVRISPENDEWQIAGQVLGSSCTGGDVDLESDSFSASVALNDICEFSFGTVPNGVYKISVRLPDLSIEIPPLELGP
jgi:hypothetical protein